MADPIPRLKTALADHYVIEHELGAGGMATVYLAEDLKHHRKVAVKVLRPELAAAIGPESFPRSRSRRLRLMKRAPLFARLRLGASSVSPPLHPAAPGFANAGWVPVAGVATPRPVCCHRTAGRSSSRT